MKQIEYGKKDASHVLLQMAGKWDLPELEKEAALIEREAGDDFYLIAFLVENWNRDLSPWEAPPAFGKEGFGSGAAATLEMLLSKIKEDHRKIFLGGYSLAGLFALWAGFQTDVFSGIAAASPSVWFPGFLDYMEKETLQTEKVYLSLGDREEKTKNPVMATVGDRIRSANLLLEKAGIQTILEWNPGNHFKDTQLRTAKAFAWLLRSA